MFQKETLSCFHERFRGDTTNTFLICAKCGACERDQVSALLPGEAEFMAQRKGEPLEGFRAKYLDGIQVGGEIIDILKCTIPCVFLNTDYSCEVKPHKPIMCLIYPLGFECNKNRQPLVHIDDSCPLAQHPKTRFYFENEGRSLVEQLQIPEKWIRLTSLFDKYALDYDKMIAERKCSIQEYKIYELDEFLSFCKF